MLYGRARIARLWAASILAGLYALCVLAPAAAFAFGDGQHAAHCLTDDNHGLGAFHSHQDDGHRHGGTKVHVHEDGTIHDHSKSKHDHGKSSGAQCCGLVCLSALPAMLADMPSPPLPTALEVFADQDSVSGEAPDRLYRPPISLLSL